MDAIHKKKTINNGQNCKTLLTDEYISIILNSILKMTGTNLRMNLLKYTLQPTKNVILMADYMNQTNLNEYHIN